LRDHHRHYEARWRLHDSLAFNTSVSFITNTNWQSYTPETTMSYLVQMAGLTVHNFVSAATGIALAVALIRGFARRSAKTRRQFLGRYDPLHALHPAADLDRRGLFSSGRACRRISAPTPSATTLEGAKQSSPGTGRLAGSDQDAGHQRRRLLQRQFGASVRESRRADQSDPDHPDLLARRGADQRVRPHGRQPAPGLGDLRGDGLLFLAGVSPSTGPKPRQSRLRAHCTSTRRPALQQAGGNMEGKEVRFGIANSALFTTITTDASCGAVNNMHDSLMPLGGMVPMVNIMLGEIIFGGVGSGLYGMLLFASSRCSSPA
jgi:K+-transporting ATPase ATPase A chain